MGDFDCDRNHNQRVRLELRIWTASKDSRQSPLRRGNLTAYWQLSLYRSID